MKKVMSVMILLMAAASLSACNTVQGAAEDVKGAAEGVKGASKSVQQNI